MQNLSSSKTKNGVCRSPFFQKSSEDQQGEYKLSCTSARSNFLDWLIENLEKLILDVVSLATCLNMNEGVKTAQK